jgi:hypothetical protein
MEPRAERGIRLVKDGICSGGNASTTELTRVEFYPTSLIVLCYLSALLTIYPVRIAGFVKQIQASIIVRKLLVEVLYSVRFHVFSPLSLYTYTIAQNLRNVKG